MNKLVNQLVNSFQLIKDEYFTDSFLPNTLCYPCTGYMLLILSDNSQSLTVSSSEILFTISKAASTNLSSPK